MNDGSEWYKGISARIEDIKIHLKPKDDMWLELDSISSAAQGIARFSHQCEQCMSFRNDIDRLTTNAHNLVNKDEQILWDSYLPDMKESIKKITDHLQKKHRLVADGYYLIACAAIGTGIGLTILALVFDSEVIGMAVGAGAGVAIGAALDTWASQKGRILFTRRPVRFSGTYWGWLLLWLGLLIALAALVFFWHGTRL